jgi:WD40 repeat protein
LVRTQRGHASWVLSLIQITDKFASGSDDSTIKFWNTESGDLIQTLKAYGPVYALTVLLNGDLISGTTTGYVEFWDPDDGLRKKYLPQGDNFIYSLVSFENGDFAVGFSGGDYKIYRSGLNISPLTIYSSCNYYLFLVNLLH